MGLVIHNNMTRHHFRFESWQERKNLECIISLTNFSFSYDHLTNPIPPKKMFRSFYQVKERRICHSYWFQRIKSVPSINVKSALCDLAQQVTKTFKKCLLIIRDSFLDITLTVIRPLLNSIMHDGGKLVTEWFTEAASVGTRHTSSWLISSSFLSYYV